MFNQKELREYIQNHLHYEAETGCFYWKFENGSLGCIAGKENKQGSIDIFIFDRIYKAHRLAWLYFKDYLPKGHIYHIDGNKTNNRIENLTDKKPYDPNRSSLMRNRAQNKNNTSGVKGVSLYKYNQKWIAYISFNKKQIKLGYFEKYDNAVFARYYAEKKYNCHKNSSAHKYLKDKGLI